METFPSRNRIRVGFASLKILILKPSSLGDVIHALPVLRLIKLHWPDAQVYWWIDTRLAPLLEHDPDLAGIVPFDRRGWAAPRNWLAVWRSVQWMRRQHFDWVIDLQCLARSGAFSWLANGEKLVGLDEPREGARGYYDFICRRPSFHTHAVDWYLRTLEPLGVPATSAFRWLPEQPQVAAGVRRKWNVDSSRWLILQPGARWDNKRWPVEYFVELSRRLLAAYPEYRLAVLGATEDQPQANAIAQVDPHRCVNLAGRTTLPEMVEWIRLGDLLVTNDTGPMHAAAALGKPLVALFGPTEPRRTGPYGQLHRVLQLELPCVPCLKSYCTWKNPLECLQTLSVEKVLTAVNETLLSRVTGS